jgi:hypothetical protein
MSNPPGLLAIRLGYHTKWHRVTPFVVLATVSRLIFGSGGQVQNQFGLMLICQLRSEGVLKNLVAESTFDAGHYHGKFPK